MTSVAATTAKPGTAEHCLDPAELLAVVKLQGDALADNLVTRGDPPAHHLRVHLAHAILMDVHRHRAHRHLKWELSDIYSVPEFKTIPPQRC